MGFTPEWRSLRFLQLKQDKKGRNFPQRTPDFDNENEKRKCDKTLQGVFCCVVDSAIMAEGQYFQAIQRKDRVSVQDFVQSGSAAYQWSDEREKSSIHHLCQYFDKDVFDYVWSKLVILK